MKSVFLKLLLPVCLVLGMTNLAQASMRCQGGIVDTGMTIFEVIELCGEPEKRDVIDRARGESGYIVQKSVTVENWSYGPQNGMYYHLRFLDGRLVELRARRY